MSKRQSVFVWALLMGCIAGTFLAPRCFAQEITASISGMVTDASGGAVPDATIKAFNTNTGAQRTTATTPAGVFFFIPLPLGDYRLRVGENGFQKD